MNHNYQSEDEKLFILTLDRMTAFCMRHSFVTGERSYIKPRLKNGWLGRSILAVITIFNRKELTIANTMEQQAKIRSLLASHNIRYCIKVVNRFTQGSSRGHTGSFGINMDAAYEYTFYVHKSDFETAQAILIL